MIRSNKPFLITAAGQENSRIPIWFMRQAGRYLPEYRKVRKGFSNFVNFCLTPTAAAEVTLQPLKRFDLDAAIVFSDILIVPHALGVEVNFQENVGPLLNFSPESQAIERLLHIDYNVFAKVNNTISIVSTEMKVAHKNQVLIGFCGAPWTVAAYMIEGGRSKEFANARKFAIQHPEKFQLIINRITIASIEYLKGQIENGAEVVKIFDSWAGLLPFGEFKKWVIEPNAKIVAAIKQSHPEVKVITFPRKAGIYYKNFGQDVASDIIALDQFTDITWAKKNLSKRILQGNLDNLLVAYDAKHLENHVEKILREFNNTPFIFNLGHGIIPDTPVENINKVIEIIRNYESPNPCK